MRNLFKIRPLFFTLAMLLLPTVGIAQNTKPVPLEIIMSPTGKQEVYGLDFKNQRRKIGELETLKRGTKLYHWHNATPKQIEKWNKEKRVSKPFMRALFKNPGAVGGGFYTSDNIFDSATYGRHLIIIELPFDITVIRANPETEIYVEWDRYRQTLLDSGISGVGNSGAQTWRNIIDLEALAKIQVATPEILPNYAIEVMPASVEVTMLLHFHPELSESQFFQDLYDRAKRQEERIAEGHPEGKNDVKNILKQGTSAAKFAAVATMKIEWVDLELAKLIILNYPTNRTTLHANFVQKIFELPFGKEIIDMALTSPNEQVRYVALSLNWELNPSETDRAMTKAQAFWGTQLPEDIKAKFSDLSQKGVWTPRPFCSQVLVQ